MQFYMEEVLPSAMRTSTLHQQSMGDLGNLLRSLKAMVKRCVSGAQHRGVGAGGETGAPARQGPAAAWGAGAGFPQDGAEEQSSGLSPVK